MSISDRLAAQIKIIEKIPFFRGLSLSQVRELLQAGKMDTYKAGEMLCRQGDYSTALYILMAGELAVRDTDIELDRVQPVDIVGEMGLVTGDVRCASVEITKDATVMVVGKLRFDAIMKDDLYMTARIYQNMLISLCSKVRASNKRWQNQDQLSAKVV